MVELADSLDSGSSVHYARAGSTPASRTKKKDTLKACLSFWVSAAKGRRYPSVFQCSGQQSHPCAKVFASGENACTLQKRRGPEGPLGEQGLMQKISILTVPSIKVTTSADAVTFIYMSVPVKKLNIRLQKDTLRRNVCWVRTDG